MTHTSAPSVLPADHPLATPSDLPYGLPDFSAVSDAQLAEACLLYTSPSPRDS